MKSGRYAPLECVIVGAPVEKGGVLHIHRAPPSTKKARLYRVFEYDAAQIASEEEAARRVLTKLARKKRKAGDLGHVEKGKELTSSTDDEEDKMIEEIEWEEEEYHIQPLYHAEDIQDEEHDEEEEEIAVFCQREHQYTGLLNQSMLQRRDNKEHEDWRIAGREELNYQAERLDCVDFLEEGVESDKQGMDDLELDYTAHSSYSNEPRWIDQSPVHHGKEVYHAFHQVPGRPNVYAFGDFTGEGFDGCGLEDSWSDPRLIKRRDVHVKTWEDGTYDYVMQEPRCTPAERKQQLRFTRAKSSHSIRYANTSRKDANHKLECLTLQLREFCTERAFQERAIDSSRVVLWQGDPKPRVVFLFKSTTKKVSQCAPYRLPIKNSRNGLGILQTELRLALEDAIRTEYSRAYSEEIKWQKVQEFIRATIPLCCQDTMAAKDRPNTREGGVALLYGVPIYDPTGWGKHSIDKYGYTDYDADYSKSYHRGAGKSNKSQTWNSGIAGSEFPDNVLELTSFYVQKALDIMSPMVVISLNKFLTRYLNSGMDSKMLQWARDVRPNKWFRVKLLSARGNAAVSSSYKNSGKKRKNSARVIQMVDPNTGVVVDEQRAETFGIRSFHPFYVTQNPQERHPVIKQTMAMVVKRIFQEMDMTRLISGQGHDITRFYMNPIKAMNDGTMQADRARKRAKFEGVNPPSMARWISGNLICRKAEMDQIRMMTDQSSSSCLINVFVICDCNTKETCTCGFGDQSNGNYSFHHIPICYTEHNTPSVHRAENRLCSEIHVFPPKISMTSVIKGVQLWPVQWIHHHISTDSKAQSRNHFSLPRMKHIQNMEKHDEIKKKAVDEVEMLLNRTESNEEVSEDEHDEDEHDEDERHALKAILMDLIKQRVSSCLFTKRVIVDATNHYGDVECEPSIDVGIYFSSMLETLERVLYTVYMKDYLDSKRVDILGAKKPGRDARKGFKRIKKGDRYLRPSEQLPGLGQIVGYIVRSHRSGMARLNTKSKLEPCTLSDESQSAQGSESNEECSEEEMWSVLEWTEILTEIATEAKKAYNSTTEYLKVLSSYKKN